MDSYEIALVALTVVSAIGLVLVFVFNAVGSIPNNGIFNNSVGNVSDIFQTDLTPAGYTFAIWGIIYFFQAAWMTYAISSIFRGNSKGRVFLNPVLFNIPFFVAWILTCIGNIVWLFLWDRKQVLASAIVLLVFTICGYAAVAFNGIAVARNEEQIRQESKAELLVIRIIVQNGLDVYFSWTTIATLLNISIALSYQPGIQNWSVLNSSTFSLCILGVIVISWSVLENTVFFNFFRYVYAWYGVLIWAILGVLVKNYDSSNRNSIITIVLLCLVVIGLIVKIVVSVVNPPCTKQPCCC